jgi:hypothetical protein
LCGVGVVDLSINPYAHSPVRKATLLSTSEVGLKGNSSWPQPTQRTTSRFADVCSPGLAGP